MYPAQYGAQPVVQQADAQPMYQSMQPLYYPSQPSTQHAQPVYYPATRDAEWDEDVPVTKQKAANRKKAAQRKRAPVTLGMANAHFRRAAGVPAPIYRYGPGQKGIAALQFCSVFLSNKNKL